MKKSIGSFLLFIFLLGIFSPTVEIYAAEKNTLDAAVDTSITLVEKLGDIADTKLELAQKKEKDSEQKERIVEKQQEIEAYIEQVQEILEEEVSSQKELKEVVEEAKKVIVLKVVSGVTEYENIEAVLPKEIVASESKKQSATEVLQDSFTTDEKISLLISSSFSLEKVMSLLRPFDENIKVEFLYEIDGKNVFEVFITKTSILAEEMLSDIQQGNIPESLLGVQLIKPELFTIGEVEQSKVNIDGEDLSQTWGISRYAPLSYLSLGTPRVSVAIIDTGVDSGHPDLSSNVKSGYDFVNDDADPSDDQGHGTHVAGTIGALNNASGIIGVNPYVDIIPLKICNEKGFCPNYAILRALDYVKDKKIKVVNMSLGGRGDPSTNPLCQSIEALTREGTIIVSAAGNSNVDTSTFVPGGCSDAITVGAVDESMTRASFSNYGTKVDVSAPGVGIYSTSLLRNYKKLSGTSMAAPHITGLVSLLKSQNPSITTSEVKQLFKSSQNPVSTQSGKMMAGFVNPKEILEKLQSKKVAEGKDTEEVKEIKEVKENQSLEGKQPLKDSDGVRIVPSVPDTSSYEVKKQQVENSNKALLEEAARLKVDTPFYEVLSDKVLDFLNLGEKTLINSDDEVKKIDEKVVPQKLEPVRPTILQGDQYFGPDGKPLDTQSIQNLDEEDWRLGSPADFVSLNDSIPNTKLQIPSEEENETPKKVELFVDGATPEDARVQSDDSSSYEAPKEVVFDVYNPNSSNILLDNEGKPVDTSSLQKITPTIEKLEYNYDYPKEVFVDGVEKGTEINSVDEEKVFEPVEVKEMNWYEEQLKKQEIEKEGTFVEPVQESILLYTNSVQNIEISSDSLSEDSHILSAEDIPYYPGMYLPSLDPLSQPNSVEINSLEPSEYLLSDGVDIAASSTPLATTTIRHTFSDLRNTNTYGGFVWNRANYSLQDTSKITLGKDFMQVNVADKWASLYTADRYNYGTNVSPKRFYGKFKTIISSSNFGRNQASGIGIYASDNTPIIDFSTYTMQVHAVSYDKSGGRDHICRTNTSFDEMKCLNHTFEPGKFIFIIYRKSNGKYTRVAYKLPDSLFGEYRVEFDVNFAKKTFVTQFFDTNNILVTTVQGDFSSLADFTNINLSDFKYYASAGTTNNSTQKNTPLEVGVDFTETPSSPLVLVPTTPKNFTGDLTGSGKVSYTWLDSEKEDKYVLKDEKNTVIIDAITSNSLTVDENNLEAGKTLQRKICATNKDGEVCSELITIKIPQRYTCTVEEGSSCQFTLPNASTFTYTFSGAALSEQTFSDINTLRLLAKSVGTTELHIKNKGLTEAIVNITVTKKIPTVNLQYYLGSYRWYNNYYFYLSYNYKYTFFDTSIVSLNPTSSYIYFNALKVGSTVINVYSGTTLVQKINVDILPPPAPKITDITVEEGKMVDIWYPRDSNYSWSFQNLDLGKIEFYNLVYDGNNYKATIRGQVAGNVKYSLKDQTGIIRYIFNIKILPTPPIVQEVSMLETRWGSSAGYIPWGNFSYSQEGMVSLGYSNGYLLFQGLKGGYVEVYLRDYNGRHTHTFKVTVLPKPVPKVYELKLQPQSYAQLTLPEPIANYSMQVDPNNSLYKGGKYLIAGPNTFSIQVTHNSIFNIYLKDQNYFDRYIIKVSVVPSEEYMEMNQTDSVYIGHSDYNIYSTNPSVVGGGTTLYGVSPGKGDIQLIRNGIHRKTIHVTVNPIPAPQEISYEVLLRNRLSFGQQGGIVSIETSKQGMYEIEYGGSTFRIRPIKSGQMTIKVKSSKGNYLSQIIKINAVALPPVQLDCSVPLGYDCVSYDLDNNSNEYTFGVTNPNIQNIVLERFTINPGASNPITNYHFIIRSKAQGTGEVYIYRHGEHIVTVKTTVLPPVTPVNVKLPFSRIREGEAIRGQVTGGVPPYKVKKIEIRDTNANEIPTKDLFVSVTRDTGEIKIVGQKKPGIYTVRIEDTYGQISGFGVTVLDALLSVSQNQINLQAGDNTTISIDDYYVALEPITKTNDNINVQLIDQTNLDQPNKPKKYLQIFAKQAGTTDIVLKDAEGTVVVVNVTVTGGNTGGSQTDEEIILTPEQKEYVTRFEADIEGIVLEISENLGVDIASRPGCTLDTQQQCIEEDILLAEDLRKIKITKELQPKIDALINKLYTKYDTKVANVVLNILIKKFKDKLKDKREELTVNKQYGIDSIILSMKTRLNTEAYMEGVKDTLSLNNLYDIAINFGAGYALGEVSEILAKKIGEKYGGKVLTRLSTKAIPLIGRGLTIFAISTAGTENIGYLDNCNSETDVGGVNPNYYCGVLTVNGLLILGGLGLSHSNPKGWFGKMNSIKWSTVPKPDLDKITSINLKTAINEIYRDVSVIGNKSTADAIRYTKATGILVGNSDHIEKGKNSINRLNNILREEATTLSDIEKGYINSIILDINSALNGN